MFRLFSTAALVATALLCFAPAAGAAAPCGSTPADGGEPLEGVLLLKAENSTTAVEFGGSPGRKNMVFAFEVSGCRLTSTEGITAKAHASEGQEAFGEPQVEIDDSELTVEVPVDAGKFGAGKHTAAVTVNGPTIVGATTKVAFQRNESWPLPTILTIVFGLIGVAAAIAAKVITADTKGRVKWPRVILAIGAAVIPVGAVWMSAYADVEIWQPTAKSIGTLLFAAVAAAAGPAGAALIPGDAIKPKDG